MLIKLLRKLLIISLLFLCYCTQNQTNNYKLFERNILEIDNINYRVFYIGPQKIEKLNNKITTSFLINKKYLRDWKLLKNIKKLSKNNLQIRIDTNINYVSYDINDGAYLGYLVEIKNITNDTLDFSSGEEISAFMEAKYENGKWIYIENEWKYIDGMAKHIILPPQYYIYTSIPKYKGIKKAKLRLNCSGNLSNEINTNIYLEQFPQDSSVIKRYWKVKGY